MPLGNNMSTTRFEVAGVTPTGIVSVSVRRVTPEYHRLLRIPLKEGRLFEGADSDGAPLVLLINEAVARAFFPNESPVGRTVKVQDTDRTVVVGVVGDIHQVSLESEPMAEILRAAGSGQPRRWGIAGTHRRQPLRSTAGGEGCCPSGAP